MSDRDKTHEGHAGARLFYYTIGAYLPPILDSGEICPAAAYMRRRTRRAVWCSYEPDWEQTAYASSQRPGGRVELGTRLTTAQGGGGFARIEVDPVAAPYAWADYMRMSGDSATTIRRLLLTARRIGADPQLWRVSFAPIPSSMWLAIETFTWGEWAAYRPGPGERAAQ